MVSLVFLFCQWKWYIIFTNKIEMLMISFVELSKWYHWKRPRSSLRYKFAVSLKSKQFGLSLSLKEHRWFKCNRRTSTKNVVKMFQWKNEQKSVIVLNFGNLLDFCEHQDSISLDKCRKWRDIFTPENARSTLGIWNCGCLKYFSYSLFR